MGVLDWLILGLVYVGLVAGAVWTRSLMKGVADFLAAGRTAGRYMLSVASGIAGLGAITVVANFEAGYEAGFAMGWWGLSMSVVMTLLAVTGWVNYRFRETRSLTLAEFFERRYSRSFRIFAGLIAFLAGLINFGIFPAVGARFFLYFTGMPKDIFGIPTYPALMAFLLATALYFVFTGGHVAVMVTDFLQGAFANIVFVILAVYLMVEVPWAQIVEVLQQVPEGKSKLNPFDTDHIENFNLGYFMVGIIGVMYSAMSWQGTAAYNTSAKSAHEAKMALVLGTWRGFPMGLVMLFVPIAAFAVMNHEAFAGLASEVNRSLLDLPSDTVRNQMRVPLVLAELLPPGLIGLFAALMLGAFISTHNTYLHSWGSIFIQDVVMPLRKQPLSKEQHMKWLRCSVVGVAVFIFLFSLFFEQNQHILMFFAITGAIFAGGSGAVIIGGLYTRFGTTAAAWCSMITGSTIAVGSIILGKANDDLRDTGRAFWSLLDWLGADNAQAAAAFVSEHLPNGQFVWATGMAASVIVYVLVSLLPGRKTFDLDALLHRGAHRLPSDESAPAARGLAIFWMGPEFPKRDRVLFALTYAWTGCWFLVFAIGTTWFVTRTLGPEGWAAHDATWISYWRGYLWIQVVVSVVVTVWFTVGGYRDVRKMFKALRGSERDESDDGWVPPADAPEER